MTKVLITILVFQVNLKDMLAHISKDILALYLSPDIFVINLLSLRRWETFARLWIVFKLLQNEVASPEIKINFFAYTFLRQI